MIKDSMISLEVASFTWLLELLLFGELYLLAREGLRSEIEREINYTELMSIPRALIFKTSSMRSTPTSAKLQRKLSETIRESLLEIIMLSLFLEHF
jgi:hypothetical protein